MFIIEGGGGVLILFAAIVFRIRYYYVRINKSVPERIYILS